MTDICARKHKGNPESREANGFVTPSKDALRNQILQYLRDTGGATGDEIVVALNLRTQTVSARLSELVADGRALKSDERRPTRSGCMARVIQPAIAAPVQINLI